MDFPIVHGLKETYVVENERQVYSNQPTSHLSPSPFDIIPFFGLSFLHQIFRIDFALPSLPHNCGWFGVWYRLRTTETDHDLPF